MNYSRLKGFFLVIVFLTTAASGQSLIKKNILIDGKSQTVQALRKGGMDYISTKDFAKVSGAAYFYNAPNKKAELRYGNSILTTTANNPFIVLTDKSGAHTELIQIPLSTIVSQNDVYVPFAYAIQLLGKVSGKKIADNGFQPVEPTTEEPVAENVEADDVASNTMIKFKIDEKANGTLVSFNTSAKVKKYETSYDEGLITIHLNGIASAAKPLSYASAKGIVREIRTANTKGGMDILIKVSHEYSTHELIQENGKSLLLTIHNKKFSHGTADNPKKEKWKFDVIVLDAGHGGQDYGAIGPNNTVEKNINLAVALKIGELIEKNMKEVKVVYTRHDDTFIELYKRGKIANENNGKLFISVHCNSVESKSAQPNGFEIYLLRPGRTQEAIRIAERENGVISYEEDKNRYQKLTDENFILVSMAHSSNMKYSEKFADLLNNHLKQTVSISSRGIKQAGFFVLVGASMPSILFETGYVTNEDDARYMKSKEGQAEIAESIFAAIKSFKVYYSQEIDNN